MSSLVIVSCYPVCILGVESEPVAMAQAGGGLGGVQGSTVELSIRVGS